MLDNKQPLWMPAGSVRAIIALSLVAALIGVIVAGKLEAAKTLLGLIGPVIGFYFGAKAAKPPAA